MQNKIPTMYLLTAIVIVELIVNHTANTASFFILYGIYRAFRWWEKNDEKD